MKYDMAVIGAGPGGYTAAIRAAQLGKKVVLIEKDLVGGSCLNYGCIPTKALHASTKLFSKIKKSGQMGISVENPSIDLSKIVDRKDRVVGQLRKGLEYLFRENKIDFVKGEAKLISPSEIKVNDQVIECSNVILATGSTIPDRTPFPVDEKKVFSTTGILNLRTVPGTMAVIGGGASGVEMACVFNALGSKVSIFEILPSILSTEDEEVAKALEQYLVKQGIEVKTNMKMDDTSGYDAVLVSVGRKLVSDGFEKIGIKMEKGKVLTNERMQTNISNVYAIGDVTGEYMLAHAAAREGIVAAENACGKNAKMDYRFIPQCVYSEPGVASVGLTEEKARAKYKDIKVGKVPFTASSKSLIEDEREGFIKMIADGSGRILGAHILCSEASEMIGEAVLAMNKGMKMDDIISTIHAHPTVYESVGEAAANALKQAITILNR